MHRPTHSRRATLFGSLAVGITVMVTTLAMAQPGAAAPAGLHPLKGAGARQSALYGYLRASTAGTARNATSQATTAPTNTHQGDDDDLADTMAAYNLERTAPGRLPDRRRDRRRRPAGRADPVDARQLAAVHHPAV